MKYLLVLVALVAIQALPASAAQPALDRTIPRGSAHVFELEAGATEVTLTPSSDTDSIHVVIDQDNSEPIPQLQASNKGNRLSVTIIPPAGRPIVPFAQGGGVRYAVTYPASMRLDLRASLGDVHIVKPSSPVEIFDQNGNITVDDPRGTVTAENAQGNITVTHALGPIDLAADDGDVTADLSNGWSGNEIRVQAATGAIHLTVPATFRARIDASSVSGAVHNPLDPQGARSPFVWLYALKGDVVVTVAKP